MALRVPFDPTLDGGPVSIGDGSASKRSIRIEAGEYATPFWLRTESGLVIPVTELPWQGVVDDAELEVLSAAPGAGIGTADIDFRPADFATIEDLLASPLLTSSETKRPEDMTLEGGRLVYNYPAGTATDYNISITINTDNVAEMWVEAQMGWSADFTVNGNGQGSGQAQKVLHLNYSGFTGAEPGGRWGVDFESSSLNAYGTNDVFGASYIWGEYGAAYCFDGTLHTLRRHVRFNGTDDFHQFWVDGGSQGSWSGDTRTTSVGSVSLAQNLNMLSDHPMEMFWERVLVYYSDPGWV